MLKSFCLFQGGVLGLVTVLRRDAYLNITINGTVTHIRQGVLFFFGTDARRACRGVLLLLIAEGDCMKIAHGKSLLYFELV